MGILFLIHTLLLFGIIYHAAFFISLKLKNFSIIHCVFLLTPTLVLIDGVYNVGEKGTTSIILTVLVMLWSARLFIHNIKALLFSKEDLLFKDFSLKYGNNLWTEFYTRLVLYKAILAFFLCAPLWSHIGRTSTIERLMPLNFIGIFIVSLCLISVFRHDYKIFKKESVFHPPHKNIEIIFWWGITFTAFKNFSDIWTCLSPLLVMSFLNAPTQKQQAIGLNSQI